MPDAALLPVDAPFPLQRRFRRRILPGLLVFVLTLAVLAAFGGRRLVEGIYLDLAQARADSIAALIDREAPQGWRALIQSREPAAAVWSGPHAETLAGAFAEALSDGRLARLKVYRPDRTTVFSTDGDEIGAVDDGDALKALLAEGRPQVVDKPDPEGPLYELYVAHRDPDSAVVAVFELYERQVFLDAILLRTLAPAVAVPVVLLAGLVWLLARLVGRAQADIDGRTARLVDLRRRLETFVSRSAVQATRSGGGDGEGRRLVMTLLYSDVRDFSGFAELAAPEAVVAFLNRLMSLQVAAVQAHGGDVDKMIGDALLARFDGPGAEARAVAAAEDLLAAVAAADLPRGVGVGVFTGAVVSGAIGPAERRDYTVIGDAVNVAARLCALAAAGELVADAATLALVGITDAAWAPVQAVQVKGRREPVPVRRRRGAEPETVRTGSAPGR